MSLLKSGRRCRKSRPLVANGPQIAVSPIKHGFQHCDHLDQRAYCNADIIPVVIDDGAKIVEKVWLGSLMGRR